jgi:hypothetical protein
MSPHMWDRSIVGMRLLLGVCVPPLSCVWVHESRWVPAAGRVVSTGRRAERDVECLMSGCINDNGS